jgi:hypothetical protein
MTASEPLVRFQSGGRHERIVDDRSRRVVIHRVYYGGRSFDRQVGHDPAGDSD